MSDATRLDAVAERLSAVTPQAVRVRYEVEDGTYVVPLVAGDGTIVEVEVACGVWADGLDAGDFARAEAVANWLAGAAEDLVWLLDRARSAV